MKKFWSETVEMVAQHYECIKCHGITDFKMDTVVNVMLHAFTTIKKLETTTKILECT